MTTKQPTLPAERLRSLADLLTELDEIYAYFCSPTVVPGGFDVMFSEATVSDDDDKTVDYDVMPVASGDLSPRRIAWDAIVNAYRTRAAEIRIELAGEGIIDIPCAPKGF